MIVFVYSRVIIIVGFVLAADSLRVKSVEQEAPRSSVIVGLV